MKTLFTNYLLTSFRHLRRSKLYTVVTVLGLAIGLAAVLLITVYIRTESYYDHFHEKGDRVYRISSRYYRNGQLQNDNIYTMIAAPGPALKAELPEIEEYTCMSTSTNVLMRNMPNELIGLPIVHYVDTGFLKLFSFDLMEGNPHTALAAPFSIVLTQKTAKQYFGDDDPMGKMLHSQNGTVYTVTGIAKNPPIYTDFGFDALISMATRHATESPRMFGWNGGWQFTTFVLLKNGVGKEQVEEKIPSLLEKYVNDDIVSAGSKIELLFHPLKKLHLFHNYESFLLRIYFYVFSVAVLIILLIACVNFVNLMLAKAIGYGREVGLRKAMGERKKGIVTLFLTESFLSCFVAFIVAGFLFWIAMPVYTAITGKMIGADAVWNWATLFTVLLLFLLTGLSAGLFPSLYLSSFASATLGKSGTSPRGGNWLRNVLVVFQFTMCILLISATVLITRQLRFYQQTPLGFNKEEVLTLSGQKMSLMKEALQNYSFTKQTALSTNLPGRWQTSNGYRIEGVAEPEIIQVFEAGADFVSLYGLEIVQGRSFTGDTIVDKHHVLVNEAFVRTFEWDDPIGKKVWREREFTIIGVLRDFHAASLHEKIVPLIVACHAAYKSYPYLSLRYQTGDIEGMLKTIKEEWIRIHPDAPFSYTFLKEYLNRHYYREHEFRTAFFWFSLLAILISVSGLFSLMTYVTSKRSKEIGIRKVMGAKTGHILWLLSKTYFGLVLIAALIAVPAAWIGAHYVLQLFAYHVSIGFSMFAVSVLIAYLVAALTMYWQAYRAATANPVHSIKTE